MANSAQNVLLPLKDDDKTLSRVLIRRSVGTATRVFQLLKTNDAKSRLKCGVADRQRLM
jgi:hypothetical protein